MAQSPWPARVTWLLLPLAAGPALGDALAEQLADERAVQIVASAGAWLVWVAVLVATLVPTTVSLTVLRIAAPTAVLASLAALVTVGTTGAAVGGLAAALVAALATLAPETAEVFVDGSSYGDERRLPLRVPAALLAGPAELAWLAAVAGPVAGPLALAAGRWVVGVLALAAGLPAAWWGARALHSLARRWLVFVPAGVVVHDPLTLAEPVLLRRGLVRSVGPAPADTEALDLTGGASGLALEVRLSEPVALVPVARRRLTAEVTDVDALLVTPSRPGRVLAEARRRRLA
ncbi:MAG: hypothetical protein ACRD0R_17970 [Acidimicrobiales bacterium]